MLEIKNKVDELAKAWEQFKQTNELKLSEIKQRNSCDPLLVDKLDRLNSVLDEYKSKIDEMEMNKNRPESYNYDQKEDSIKKFLFSNSEHKLNDSMIFDYDQLNEANENALISNNISGQESNIRQSIMWQLSTNFISVKGIKDVAVDFRSEDASSLEPQWHGDENEDGDSKQKTIDVKRIPMHEMYYSIIIDPRLIEDTDFNLTKWMKSKIFDAFITAEDSVFIIGDEQKKPQGLLYACKKSNECQKIAIDPNNDIKYENILDLISNVKSRGGNRAFLMNGVALSSLRKEKDQDGRYIWNPLSFDSTRSNILGIPVYELDSIEDEKCIIYGDIKNAYATAKKRKSRILKDRCTYKPNINLYIGHGIGGAALDLSLVSMTHLKAS